jgi:hypothetical protein
MNEDSLGSRLQPAISRGHPKRRQPRSPPAAALQTLARAAAAPPVPPPSHLSTPIFLPEGLLGFVPFAPSSRPRPVQRCIIQQNRFCPLAKTTRFVTLYCMRAIHYTLPTDSPKDGLRGPPSALRPPPSCPALLPEPWFREKSNPVPFSAAWCIPVYCGGHDTSPRIRFSVISHHLKSS